MATPNRNGRGTLVVDANARRLALGAASPGQLGGDGGTQETGIASDRDEAKAARLVGRRVRAAAGVDARDDAVLRAGRGDLVDRLREWPRVGGRVRSQPHRD